MQGAKRGGSANKPRGRGVAHPMSNARVQSIKARAVRKGKTTSVIVPMIGWQHPEPLNIKHKVQQRQLRRVLISAAHRERPISVGVHGSKCPLSIFVLPRLIDVDDFVALNECVKERDERCTCTPVIMYTGAKA